MAPPDDLPAVLRMRLRFAGNDADRHELDLYDSAHALLGLQRTVALTTHLVLHGEIITQAPSLRDARVMASPPRPGSWETELAIFVAGTGFGGLVVSTLSASKDSPLGYFIFSLMDWVVHTATGEHPDFERTVLQNYEDWRLRRGPDDIELPLPEPTETKALSLVEKVEPAITSIHRPVVKSKSAEVGRVVAMVRGGERVVGQELTQDTYDYVRDTITSDLPEFNRGRVSSYNANTFHGRMFIESAVRPIPFDLAEDARSPASISLILSSLDEYAQNAEGAGGFILVTAFVRRSRNGRLKGMTITRVEGA